MVAAIAVCACGTAGTARDGPGSPTTVAGTAGVGTTPVAVNDSPLAEATRDRDGDSDIHVLRDDAGNGDITRFGHPAGARQYRALSALIGLYYTAALAEEGAKACSMLEPALTRSISGDFAGTLGLPDVSGSRTCAQAMTLLFRHYHPLLLQQTPRLRVRLVHLKGRYGVAQLSFGAQLPERQLSLSLQRDVWTIASPRDGALP